MIKLSKNGIFFDNDINPEHEDHISEKVESIIPYLGETIEFDRLLTLRDFFSLLEPDAEMIETVFSSHLGGHPIQPYMDEIKNDCIPDGKEDMEYIECSWVAEQFDYHLFYAKYQNNKDNEESIIAQLDTDIIDEALHEPTEDDENELSLYIDIHGYGKYIPHEDEYEDGADVPENTSYTIEFTPLNKIAHLHLKLNKYVEIRDRNELEDTEPLVEGNMYFSVFEIVGAILSEISFCGLPEERDARWQEISDSIDEAKEDEKYKNELDEEEDDDEYDGD